MWVSSGPQVDAGLQSQDKGWAGEAAALDTVVSCEVGGTTGRLGGGDLCWKGEFWGRQVVSIVLGVEIWGGGMLRVLI